MNMNTMPRVQHYLEMMDDYMSPALSYEIILIFCKPDEIVFSIREAYCDPYELYIRNDRIYNSHGEDCIETMKSAYESDEDMLEWIERFEKRWYVE